MNIIYSTLTHTYVRKEGCNCRVIDTGGKPNLECCYGIAYYPTFNCFVLAKRDGEEKNSLTHLLFLDRDYQKINQIDIPGCKGAHQIAINDDIVYTTATVTNEIFATNLQTGKSHPIYMHFDNSEDEVRSDINHVNSIYFGDNNDLFVYCHNHGRSFVAELDRNIFINNFSCKVKRTYEDVGTKGHNVYVFDDKIYTLSSADGCLVCHDRKTGSLIKRISLENRFLRGLTRKGDFLYVGGSHRGKRSERSVPQQIAIFKVGMENMKVDDRVAINQRANILEIFLEN